MSNRFKKIKKERIFEMHAQHLELLKQHYSIKLIGKKTEGYICPLCYKMFGKEAFDDSYADQLTLEHVPPGGLGGSVELLTCKICNNEHGSKLERDLKEKLLTSDFFLRIPGSSRPARFLTDDKWNIGGKIVNSETGFRLNAIKDNSHHKHYQKLFKEGISEINKIQVTIYGQYNNKTANIALLRTGFLMLYSKFGYPVLMNPNMRSVRKQINEPDKEILKEIGSINLDYDERFEGINIVTNPKELKSFAVLFRTQTENKTRKHAVLLPGPTEPGLSIYENLNKLSGKSGKIDLELTKLDLDESLLKDHRLLDYFWYWRDIEKIKYQTS